MCNCGCETDLEEAIKAMEEDLNELYLYDSTFRNLVDELYLSLNRDPNRVKRVPLSKCIELMGYARKTGKEINMKQKSDEH